MLRSFHTALSRSNQCVAIQAPASSTGAHQLYAASTAADATPANSSTKPDEMNPMEIVSGGPLMPRSKSRAMARSVVSRGSSRCPIPGGRTQAWVS